VTISLEELQLATRNHGMPLEALRWDVTPVGLHYLLIHYDIPLVDGTAWALEVGGRVERPLRLTLPELEALPSVELAVTMECAGNGRARLEPRPASQPWLVEAVGTALWRGVPLRDVLEHAEPAEDAAGVVFTGLDRGVEGGEEQSYQRGLPLEEALDGEALLAYEMNGRPLPPQHGFPLRLVVPGWYGMTNVKWLAQIDVTAEPFAGYQHERAYRFRRDEEDEGEPLVRMAPRSLLVPPGIPDFFSRERTLEAGEQTLEGRAWSGHAPVEAVDVTTDGGETWEPARLDPDPFGSRWAWRRWAWSWDATPGTYLLGSRARDEAGNAQPVEPPWNLGGYANNAVQWVRATVRDRELLPGAGTGIR
jgi:DMSO/TMAO reductase YedYZ molybdopterin-dependent catalytic subunit